MFESINNVLDMLFTICFYRYLQFHFMETVKVFELIMVEFNNICICIRQHLRYRNQLTWFIRKKMCIRDRPLNHGLDCHKKYGLVQHLNISQ